LVTPLVNMLFILLFVFNLMLLMSANKRLYSFFYTSQLKAMLDPAVSSNTRSTLLQYDTSTAGIWVVL